MDQRHHGCPIDRAAPTLVPIVHFYKCSLVRLTTRSIECVNAYSYSLPIFKLGREKAPQKLKIGLPFTVLGNLRHSPRKKHLSKLRASIENVPRFIVATE